MTSMISGEEHTPSKSLQNTGLLVYRYRTSEPELFVRYSSTDKVFSYSIPNREPYLGETALETAMRVGLTSLGVEIPEDKLSYRESAVIENLGDSTRIRVFLLEATPEFEELALMRNFRGWKYTWVSLKSFDRLWLHPDIGLTPASLRAIIPKET
ncbi:hypothetical protein SAMD00023353_6500300 [Rosellinia necatrix]|uniref:Nudix hydrolase domain-containing protein n=1 Tax=Rosellinia necatrix TaxID=77044 RepID=A0A1W2TSN9_ROSNE|nr:hypothetical protein SAMD00023353_6500300 [Rosellinia necatrix]